MGGNDWNVAARVSRQSIAYPAHCCVAGLCACRRLYFSWLAALLHLFLWALAKRAVSLCFGGGYVDHTVNAIKRIAREVSRHYCLGFAEVVRWV